MLEKLASQLPSAVAIIVVVAMFIKYLTEEAKNNRDFFKELHGEHMEQRTQSRNSMDKMIEITERNISSTNRNTYTIEQLVKSIDRTK